MTGHLLFVLMCCCHEIQVQASLPPKLTVNSAVISETESVTLHCRPPSYLSVFQCNFDFGGHVRVTLCLQTLTGTELLHISHQRSPAEIKVKCFYIEKLQDINSPSPHSDISSIIIHSSTNSVSPSPRFKCWYA
ncbi:uncharacterized protein LOC117815048 isoform X6 [Xyrichtys novacula]|uniref:Uncharacterized protein LOC117815048 isoform X6 n=1 Tax=Xyrichtys novacula TaxID=13765 RepID=A0AAV1ETU3_XYRNO|nr:uncharacterized protein LOC117815048 isoform X6 [Xyrichtys novacula]